MAEAGISEGSISMGINFEDFERRRVKGAIYSFSRGKADLKWVLGVIKGSWGIKGKELEKIFQEIPTEYINYDANRLHQVEQKCKNEGLT